MLYDVIVLSITALFIGFVFKKILPGRGIGQITAEELRVLMKKDNIQLIDVRKPFNYSQSHIPGFQNIPLRDIRKQAEDRLSKEQKVVVICRTGTQANEAAKRLRRKGFKDVDNVRGGLSTWDPMARVK